MNKYSFGFSVIMVSSIGCVNGSDRLSSQEETECASVFNVNASGAHSVTEREEQGGRNDGNDHLPEEGTPFNQFEGSKHPMSGTSQNVNDHENDNRSESDFIIGLMCAPADEAILNLTELLTTHNSIAVDIKEVDKKPYIEIRAEECEVIRYARAHINKFEVSQFYNHCPNHSGWGKRIAQGCQTWQKRHLLRAMRNPAADYEESVIVWETDAHPGLEALINVEKDCLVKENFLEEGREARMIPVKKYTKVETNEDSDWVITEIEAHREERMRLKRPEDLGLESFVKRQIYVKR